MSLLLLVAVSIFLCTSFILIGLKPDNIRPSKSYFALLTFTAAIWFCFLTGGFTVFSDKLSMVLWNSSWLSVLVLGMMTFILEIRRSLVYAFIACFITIINGGFYMLAKLIASM